MNKKRFFITTAIDYIDDVIHIGHAYQKIVADVLARYHRLLGDKVFFLTGVDEHGGKTEEAAEKAGLKFKEWADKISQADKKQLQSLNISFDRYIRTTDKDHKEMVKNFWLRVQRNGDIYLGNYTGIYCDGCEGFITEKDLVEGKCPYHPSKTPRKLTEKNYFFRWSKYENFLKNHIKTHPDFVIPESRRNEMLSFLDQGLEDIPISRPTVKWGIPVPNNPKHTIYVWFDALINYLTGAPKGFWPADVHLLGKDNVRWHALLWPAMLKSAGYQLPKTVYGHGFISLNGQKISKSLGNIIRPSELVRKFGGADPIRYYLLKVKPLADDGDLSLEKLTEVYNADLANGLGNLVQRIAKLAERLNPRDLKKRKTNTKQNIQDIDMYVKKFEFHKALDYIWLYISTLDKYIDKKRPWEQTGDEFKRTLGKIIVATEGSRGLLNIAYLLRPFLPDTAEKIEKIFTAKKIKAPKKPLFPRI